MRLASHGRARPAGAPWGLTVQVRAVRRSARSTRARNSRRTRSATLAPHVLPLPEEGHLLDLREDARDGLRLDKVARRAGQLLTQSVDDHQIIGVARGTTVARVEKHVTRRPLVHARVVQLNWGRVRGPSAFRHLVRGRDHSGAETDAWWRCGAAPHRVNDLEQHGYGERIPVAFSGDLGWAAAFTLTVLTSMSSSSTAVFMIARTGRRTADRTIRGTSTGGPATRPGRGLG